jgi:hypothetical protein
LIIWLIPISVSVPIIHSKNYMILLATHIGKNVSQDFSLQQVDDKKIRQYIARLQKVNGAGLSEFPEVSILRVDAAAGKWRYFTILHNKSYSNISQLLDNARASPAC